MFADYTNGRLTICQRAGAPEVDLGQVDEGTLDLMAPIDAHLEASGWSRTTTWRSGAWDGLRAIVKRHEPMINE